MVVEVNKLIANALLSDGGIYLPEIGSLSIVTKTPENSDPIRDIILSEDKQCKSLIDVISERGNCTPQQAEQVFKRWYNVVTENERTSILGIGYISDGKFTLTSQMYNKLNPVQAAKAHVTTTPPAPAPKPETPKAPDITEVKEDRPKIEEIQKVAKVDTPKPTKTREQQSSKGSYVWLLVAAIVVVVGISIYMFTSSNSTTVPESVAIEEPALEVETEVEVKVEPLASTPTPTPVATTSKIDISSDPAKVLQSALTLGKNSQLKYRVVYGVFSSHSNGGNAIIKMAKEHPNSAKIDLKAYPYGKETYILTLFESNDEAECQSFMRSNLGQSISKELWIHAKK